jgi:hypothetical protein
VTAARADHDRIVRAFFEAYAKRTNEALARPPRVDVKGLRDAFADYFVAADPNGVQGGRNGLLFRLMLRWGFRTYRRMGTRAIDLVGLEISSLDDFHAVARTDWVARYDGSVGDGEDIPFSSHYFLQIREGEARIFAYVTPDEQQALKEHGLIQGR